MDLYHFTDLWNLHNSGPDNIMVAGLLPRSTYKDYGNVFAGHPDVVWLTSRPDQVLFEDESGKKIPKEVRITVSIPAQDRLLSKWTAFLRKRYGYSIEDLPNPPNHQFKYWYVYFGKIPRNRLSIELAPGSPAYLKALAERGAD